jgi:hypothetical protein
MAGNPREEFPHPRRNSPEINFLHDGNRMSIASVKDLSGNSS